MIIRFFDQKTSLESLDTAVESSFSTTTVTFRDVDEKNLYPDYRKTQTDSSHEHIQYFLIQDHPSSEMRDNSFRMHLLLP